RRSHGPGVRRRQRRRCSWPRSALGGRFGLLGGFGFSGRRGFLSGRGFFGLIGRLLGGLLRRRLLLLRLGGLGVGSAVGGGQRRVEQLELGRLGLGDLQPALSAGQALELLPVAGDFQQLEDGLGGLGADRQPVL